MVDITNIFKAYDIRGKVGTELTPDIALVIGRSFTSWLGNKTPIAVGYDMRPDSKSLAEAVIKGITKQGSDVWDIGEVTSDMVYFATGYYKLAGGVMITASHNPGEYNGIKFCREEAKPIGEETGLIEICDLALNNSFKSSKEKGTIKSKDVTEDWITHVLSFIKTNTLKELKIVVDAGNGMAGKVFPELEPYVPFEVDELYFDLDGSFPNHIANPLLAENLVDIQKAVKEKRADVGIAFDGDGDRAVLVDEKGVALSGTVMTALLAEYFLKQYPGAIILCNAICGRIVDEVVKQNGGKLIKTRVGHSFIKADMRKYQAIFAGEHSGHYYFKDNFMADSGLIAAVVALYILSISNKPLSELVAKYRNAYVQIPEINFEVTEKQALLEHLKEAFSDGDQNELDGLTVNYPSFWFNVRASNTEPVVRLNAEAKTKEQLDKIVKKVTRIIKP
ncbi:MAG: phosphomannomutase/phosphoglucomutase [Candidatus Saccharimonadales bacterium]